MDCVAHGVAKSQTRLSDFHSFTHSPVFWDALVAQTVKRLPIMRETWVRSLGREDPLEKEMATHPSILAWKTPWTEKRGRLQSLGSKRVGYDCATSLSFIDFRLWEQGFLFKRFFKNYYLFMSVLRAGFSRCGDFSGCRAQALECGLGSCGTLPCGRWDLPGPGTETVSRVGWQILHPEPPGKSQDVLSLPPLCSTQGCSLLCVTHHDFVSSVHLPLSKCESINITHSSATE